MKFLPALLLLQAAPAATRDALPLGTLPPQALPAKGCAAFLWTIGDSPVLVAMAGADPARLRVSLGGAITDLARTAQHGEGSYGFAGTAEYRGAAATATLDMTIAERADIKDGAGVPSATLRVDRDGQDSIVIPLAGLIGCAS